MKYKGNYRHGDAKNGKISREYKSWQHMRERCYNKNDKSYFRYGGRGIFICKRWKDYALFLKDMGRCPKGLTLDRIDNDGWYEPDNCRWTTYKIQANNTRKVKFYSAFGKTLTLAQWADIVEVPKVTLWRRFNTGWPIEKALTLKRQKPHCLKNGFANE